MMELSLAKDQSPTESVEEDASVLLLDTPENPGVDFLQILQKLGINFISERVNDKEASFNALKSGKWDLLLVSDQLAKQLRDDALIFKSQIGCETGIVLLTSSVLTIELLTESYKKGYCAVVSSEHPEYSLEVFVRAVERSRSNFRLGQLNQEKFDLRRHCEQLASGTEEALAYLSDGIHIYSNEAYLKLLGHTREEDLLYTPFIDVVAAELQDETKETLLDYQHKLLKNPDTSALEISELFVQGNGEHEDILQVSAVLKPAVHDGEDCIQIVLKNGKSQEVEEDASATMEGLGYPLFITHLENYVVEARNANTLMGYVVQVQGGNFEHYIAKKGFGLLNGKLKALASELKRLLGKEDLMIRFSSNSFLLLLKDVSGDDADNNPTLKSLNSLLATFEATLNIDAGDDVKNETEEAHAISLTANIISVDGQSTSAEALVKSFLLSGAEKQGAVGSNGKNPKDNVIPFTDKALESNEHENSKSPAEEASGTQAKGSSEQESEADAQAKKVKHQAQAATGNEKQQDNNQAETKPSKALPEACTFTQDQLTESLSKNNFKLFCEIVISVLDIETEFYHINTFIEGVKEKITRHNLADTLSGSALRNKLDMWVLQHAVAVVGELYKQGQEYRLILPFSSASLALKNLHEQIKTETGRLALPPEMLVVDFSMADVVEDIDNSIKQLEKLTEAGVSLGISEVSDCTFFDEFAASGIITVVSLDHSLIAQAEKNEEKFKCLVRDVENLQKNKIKVIAADIDSNELLNVCYRANIDLVMGRYIQNSPLPLNEDSLGQEMVI